MFTNYCTLNIRQLKLIRMIYQGYYNVKATIKAKRMRRVS